MATFNPKRRDFEPYGFSCVKWEASLMPRMDRHNEIEINLLGNGSLTYLFGGKKITVPNHRLVLFWAGIPHQVIHIDQVNEYYVMTIPLSWFLQLKLPGFFVHKLFQSQMFNNPDSDDYDMDELLFTHWRQDLESNTEEMKQICLLEVEARLRRLVNKIERSTQCKPNKFAVIGEADLNDVEKMAGFIAQNFTQSITVDDIANSVKLHPNYAMRVFRKTFGKTMIEFITEHRLSYAQQSLITSNDLIIDIAFNAGFGSLSRFNAAFKQSFDCTPSEYRNQYK